MAITTLGRGKGKEPLVPITILLDDKKQYTINKDGDFIFVDPLYTTADISKVYIKFNDSPVWLRLLDYNGSIVLFKKITLKWEDSEIGKQLLLVIGRDFNLYNPNMAKETTQLLIKDRIESIISIMQSKLTPEAITVNLTADTPTQIGSGSFKMLMIQNNGLVDVYFGTSTKQNIKIPSGGGLLTISLPMDKYGDLSEHYLYASVDTSVEVIIWR